MSKLVVDIDKILAKLKNYSTEANDFKKSEDDSKLNKENFTNQYESYIFKIPSILLDNKEDIALYIRLEVLYGKLTSITEKYQSSSCS